MPWERHRGHRDQITLLRRAMERNRLPHAVLFLGPAGIGKRHFAGLFARCLFCERHRDAELRACGECGGCKRVIADTHPDLMQVGLLEGKTELLVDQFLGPPERRGREGLLHELSLRPMSGERRIAIIDAADRMNEETANALLKTLEEPPPQALLILIAESLDSLLPTIRSRCQVLRFGPLADADVGSLLGEMDDLPAETDVEDVAALSDGSLETAKQLLDPELRRMREQLTAALGSPGFHPVTNSERMMECIETIGKDVPAQRQAAIWMLRFAIEHFRQTLETCHDDAAEVAGEIIDAASDSIEHLGRYAPVVLVVEEFFAAVADRRAVIQMS